MKHLEVHLLETEYDWDLSVTAGLTESGQTDCDMCGLPEVFRSGRRAASAGYYVLISSNSHVLACASCVGVAMQTVMVYG